MNVVVYVVFAAMIICCALIVSHPRTVIPLEILLLEPIFVRPLLEVLPFPIAVVEVPPLLGRAFFVISWRTTVALLLLLLLLRVLRVPVPVVESALPWEHVLRLCRIVVPVVRAVLSTVSVLRGAEAER